MKRISLCSMPFKNITRQGAEGRTKVHQGELTTLDFEWRRVVPAFTLLECLVSLLVIIGSVQVYQGLTQVLSHQVTYLSENSQEDWLLFCQQLQAELEGAHFDKVENHKLYVTKDNKKLAFGKYRSDDFRKTNANGQGYQPMLFGLESSAISQEENRVIIVLTFKSGLERSFVYAFD